MARRKKISTAQPLLLSVADVAVLLGVCRTTVYKYMYHEGLPSMLLRGVPRFILTLCRNGSSLKSLCRGSGCMAKHKRRAHGEGTLTHRKDGRWQAGFYTAEGKQRFVYGDTQQEALEKLRRAQNDYRQGTLVTGPKLKLDAYLKQWLEEVKRPNIRVSTYVKYEKLVRLYIVPVLGGVQLQKVSPQHIQSLYTKMVKQKISSKTVHNVHGLLHNALDNAVRWNLVARNVVDLVSPPRLEKPDIQPLTLKQARDLLETARGQHLEVFIALALTTGMRRGELLALRWSDIDFESHTVYVHRTVDFIARYGYVETEPKMKRSKLLLPAFVVEMLKVHRKEQLEQRLKAGTSWQDLDLVVCGLEGNYLNLRYILKMFDRLLREAGLPHMRIHDLRHNERHVEYRFAGCQA